MPEINNPYSILIAHPERQHSHQLAAALDSIGLLGHYIHGAALTAKDSSEITREYRQRITWYQSLRRAVSYAAPEFIKETALNNLLTFFDQSLARRLSNCFCKTVIGYESSSWHMFREAKRLGMSCILDAASVHHSMQSQLFPTSNNPAKIKIKNGEIELADLILTCSTLARQSYIDAGVSPGKLVTVPLGVDTHLFRNDKTVGQAATKGPIRFCSSGRLVKAKGFDLLADACQNLRACGLEFTISIAAAKIGADPKIISQLMGLADLVGRVPHNKLYRFYSKADVFVFPSRFDSFAMVVSEALACGLPVIVTQNVGAKDMVVEGVNGWIIPANDVDALAERMSWCANNPEAVRAMAPAARKSAEARDWNAYRADVAQVVQTFLDHQHSKVN